MEAQRSRALGQLEQIATKIDSLISASRLQEIAVIMALDRQSRLAKLADGLKRLSPGAYLVGTGPSTVGVFPLSVEEVVLGRIATPGEEPSGRIIDYTVNDCLYLSPHEVSRAHARIVREVDSGGVSYRLMDLGSTCGTFVNGERVEPGDKGRVLAQGDVISLGPRQVSTYVFFIAEPRPGKE